MAATRGIIDGVSKGEMTKYGRMIEAMRRLWLASGKHGTTICAWWDLPCPPPSPCCKCGGCRLWRVAVCRPRGTIERRTGRAIRMARRLAPEVWT